MGPNNPRSKKNHDQIVGKKLILFDRCKPGEKVLKKVEIYTENGEVRNLPVQRNLLFISSVPALAPE